MLSVNDSCFSDAAMKKRQGPFEVEQSDNAIVSNAFSSLGVSRFAAAAAEALYDEGEAIPNIEYSKVSEKVVALFPKRAPTGDESCAPVLHDKADPETCNLPVRNYDCANYGTCLGLAAALDWTSFSCKGCSGCVDQKLIWRAHHRTRQNKALQKLCNLPVLR